MLIRTQNGRKIIDARVVSCPEYVKDAPFTLYASASTESFHIEIGKYNTLEEAMNMLAIIFDDAKRGKGSDLYNYEKVKAESQSWLND